MDLLQIAQYVIATIILPAAVYIFRELSMLKERVMQKPDIVDVEKLIDLKQQVLDSRQKDLKEDLTRIEEKIDKLLDRRE
jgi:acetolactate synthase small subunit